MIEPGGDSTGDSWAGTTWSTPELAAPVAMEGAPEVIPEVQAGAARPPAWLELPSPPRGRFRIGPIAALLLILVVATGGYLLWVTYRFSSEHGQVMFTTVDPGGGNGCYVVDRVTSVPAGSNVWMVVVFDRPLGDEPARMDISWNGSPYWSYTWPLEDSQGRLCTYSEDLYWLPSGQWEFAFYRGAVLETSGTLEITGSGAALRPAQPPGLPAGPRSD